MQLNILKIGIFMFCVSASQVVFCQTATQNKVAARHVKAASEKSSAYTKAADLTFLIDLNGHYPHDVKLFNNPVIKTRLKRMLGAQYNYLKSIWEVEIPIKIENGLMYTWAMQAHSGGDPSAALVADINKNVLYVRIRKDKKDKIYSEDGSIPPKKLND